jgi:uncharacterized protein YfaS (alpha-2-macroglobulin family)
LWQTPLGSHPWELLDSRLPSPSRFFFDASSGEPTAADIDGLIADTFRGRARPLATARPADRPAARIEDGRVPFTDRADLVEYFTGRGRNLYRAWTGRELPR